jgi:hydroxymethylbilane synthase
MKFSETFHSQENLQSSNQVINKQKIRIGTRSSQLAMSQVAEVISMLSTNNQSSNIEIVQITTSGDKILDRNLSEIGGKGLFIKELEEALINDKIDVAVHSAKDVPPVIDSSTIIAAITKRFDARDSFISKNYSSILDLPKNAVIGTSSARRKAFILKIRPDLKIINFRGNVNTRLEKVEKNQVDATILAICGLQRLSFAQKTCPKGYENIKPIDKEIMLPAGGQGSLILQCRKNDVKSIKLASQINHKNSEICVKAERKFLQELNASCSTPVGVHAEILDNKLVFKSIILDFDGSDSYSTSFLSNEISINSAELIAEKACLETKKNAAELLKKISILSDTQLS